MGKKENREKWKNKSHSLNLDPMIKSLILHMYAMFDDCSLNSSGKIMTQIYPENTEKWTNKGKSKSNDPDSKSSIQHVIVHVNINIGILLCQISRYKLQ